MVLRSDDLLDQLDSRLSKMQAQLPSNPDTRPLPSRWVEHLDPHRKIWYYIDLGAAQPRATFVHPIDEGEENTPPPSSTCIRSGSSGSSTRPPSRTRGTPVGSSVCRRATTAQQLYASSLASGSKISKTSRESVSSGANSDTPPERSCAANQPGSSRGSPIGPGFPVYPNSHDPRNFFDLTRLSHGARKYRHDESPASADPASPASIPSEAQALYNPSVVAKPLSPSRAAIVADRHVSVPLAASRSPKRPQPIQIIPLESYTAVTEDESLKAVPHSGLAAYPGVTEDNLLVLPSHPTPPRDSHTINVLDVQNPEPVLPELKSKSPVRSLSISRLHIKKKKKPASVDNDTLVLQQPRPVHPLGGLSAQLNDQASGAEDAQYYSENFKGKGKERKSYGFSSIFETMDRLADRESGIIIKELHH